MDKFYLKNILESHYVDEGLGDKIKSYFQRRKSPKNISNTVPPVQTHPPGNSTTVANDLVNVIDRVVDIIIDAVKSDETRSAQFIGKQQKELPTTWQDPVITKETRLKETDDDDDDDDDHPEAHSKEDTDFKEMPGQFLYNFHGKYRKFPGDFTIKVEPQNKELNNITLKSNNMTKFLEVLWHSHSHLNEIYLRHADVDPASGKQEKPLQTKIFSFYDHDVEPRVAGSFENFSVEKILRQANPKYLSSIENASPQLLNGLNSKKEILFRSLYATVLRKSMEWKSKKKTNMESNPNAEDAISALEKLGHKKKDAIELISNVLKTAPHNAPVDKLVTLALENPLLKPSPVGGNSPEVSKPAGSPSPESPVTAPVSNSDKDKISGGDVGRAIFDDNGNIVWTKPDGQVRKFTLKQFKKIKSPRLEKALDQVGFFKKFPDAIHESKFINPYQSVNFL